MSLAQVLTAYHDPTHPGRMLVSARASVDAPRDLHSVERPRPRIVRRHMVTGEREYAASEWPHPYLPVHGHRDGEHEYFQLPPDWRWSLPVTHSLPTTEPAWLSCTLFFVWGSMRIAGLSSLDGTRAKVFWSVADAFHTLYAHWPTDVLFACTPEAQDDIERERSQKGWREFARKLPVVCPIDLFVRTASLDRTADGAASWYRPPFRFAPDEYCSLSEQRRDDLVLPLMESRRAWIVERRVVSMMFSLSELTRLPLHEVAVAHQTMLADALVEWVWMRSPLDFDAPRVVQGDPTDDELRRFEGASVLDAALGLHTCTVLMPDVRSLYPTVVLEYLRNEYPLMAEVFCVMVEFRVAERDPIRAASLKVITSSRYGTLKYGRYRDQRLAERITASGRRVQRESLDALERSGLAGLRVIAGDTDSLAIAVNRSVDTPEMTPRLVTTLNAGRKYALYKNDVDRFSTVFFVSNKSWAGVRASDGKIITRGLAQNRSVTPAFVLPLHHEWTRLVLTDAEFQQSASMRAEWIAARAKELRTTAWPVADLVVWPKPTRDHPDTDRGYVVLRNSREHIAYKDYMALGVSRLPVDVDYLVQLYFVDELTRHTQLLSTL